MFKIDLITFETSLRLISIHFECFLGWRAGLSIHHTAAKTARCHSANKEYNRTLFRNKIEIKMIIFIYLI